jgi:hypothetical protein
MSIQEKTPIDLLENKNLKRCFLHELGHSFANHYNAKHFSMYETHGIDFFYFDEVNDFRGEITPSRPIDYTKEKYPLVNLPETLAQITYGCIFQSLFLGHPFETCFDMNNWNHGQDDRWGFNGGLKDFGIQYSSETGKLLYKYVQKYCEDLRYENTYFDELFAVDFKDLLNMEKSQIILGKPREKFSVNIPELNHRFIDFMDRHESKYLEFVEHIKEIINWDSEKKTISKQPNDKKKINTDFDTLFRDLGN